VATTQETKKFAFTDAEKAEIKEIADRYPDAKAACLPALWVAQNRFGWVNDDVCAAVAEEIGAAPAHVRGVAGFYTMYNKKPVGKFHVQVCATLSCSLMGAEHIYDYISKKLGINSGQTTADDKYSLLKVECLGSCGTAPMMQINEDYYENLTEEKVDKILASLE
jgi:NADH-quinone oxidoreductase E subunit